MLKVFDSNGNEIKGKIKYEIGIFYPSKLEMVLKSGIVNLGEYLEVKDDSGNILFKGKVFDKSEVNRGLNKIIAYSDFIRMANDYRALNFFNQYNSDIINSLVGLYGCSVDWSGVDVDNEKVKVKYFVQNHYTFNEVMKLLYMSGWFWSEYYSSGANEWYLKPIKENITGDSWQEGDNNGIKVFIVEKKEDTSDIINKIIVRGKTIQIHTDESGIVADGSGGEYDGYGYIKTMHKIGGNVKLLIDGSKYDSPQILAERGIILIDSSKVGSSYEVSYSYYDTPIIMKKDTNSISEYGERLKVRVLDSIDVNDLINYANGILKYYASPNIDLRVEIFGKEYNVGGVINLKMLKSDGSYDSGSNYVIYKKIWENGRWYYKCGNDTFIFSMMKNILEQMSVEMGLLNIGAMLSLTDNALDLDVIWQGQLYGKDIVTENSKSDGSGYSVDIEKKNVLLNVFKDSGTDISQRYGKGVSVVAGKTQYTFSGIATDGFLDFSGFKVSKNNMQNCKFSNSWIDLNLYYVVNSNNGINVYNDSDNIIFDSNFKGGTSYKNYLYVSLDYTDSLSDVIGSSYGTDLSLLDLYLEGSKVFSFVVNQASSSDDIVVSLKNVSSGNKIDMLSIKGDGSGYSLDSLNLKFAIGVVYNSASSEVEMKVYVVDDNGSLVSDTNSVGAGLKDWYNVRFLYMKGSSAGEWKGDMGLALGLIPFSVDSINGLHQYDFWVLGGV